MTLTVVILTRGLDALVRLCLQHLKRSADTVPGLQYRIVVVDNASSPPFSRLLDNTPPYDCIRCDQHQSFAAGCNLGASRYPADYFLFLNNDVLLHEQALTAIFSLIKSDQQLGICGTRMVFPDDTIQHAGVIFRPGKRGPVHEQRHLPTSRVPRTTTRFPAVTGACMLVARDVFDAVGGFNEDYPFGGEDIDLCLRTRQAGWEIGCAQDVDSVHFESMTPGREELDVPSRKHLMETWKDKYSVEF